MSATWWTPDHAGTKCQVLERKLLGLLRPPFTVDGTFSVRSNGNGRLRRRKGYTQVLALHDVPGNPASCLDLAGILAVPVGLASVWEAVSSGQQETRLRLTAREFRRA